MMTGTSRELAVAHGAQFAAQRLLGHDDAEFLPYPLAEIDDPPSYDAVKGGDRTALDDRRQRGPMRIVQSRRLPRRLSIDQAAWPVSVELENPIANDLKRHAADLGRPGARGAFVNRRQSYSRRACGPSFERLAANRTIWASKSARSGMGMANLLSSLP